MEDTLEEEQGPSAVRFYWVTVPMHVLAFIGNVFNAAGVFSHSLAQECASQANYKMQRDEFAAEAGREIEMLLEGSDGG